jgi:hypothetical protein
MKPWKLSPSDFAFLWEECPRCFYLKVARGFGRPSAPFPSIFSKIDSRMKDFFANKRTEDILPSMPPGVVSHSGKGVESEPLFFEGFNNGGYIRGNFDTILNLDDESFAVVDFKTSEARPEHLGKYSRQLHAYAYALQHPAQGKMYLSPITRLGLLVYEPSHFGEQEGNVLPLTGSLTWVELPLDMPAFVQFLGTVIALLDQPEPPPAAPTCGFCKYREESRLLGL